MVDKYLSYRAVGSTGDQDVSTAHILLLLMRVQYQNWACYLRMNTQYAQSGCYQIVSHEFGMSPGCRCHAKIRKCLQEL